MYKSMKNIVFCICDLLRKDRWKKYKLPMIKIFLWLIWRRVGWRWKGFKYYILGSLVKRWADQRSDHVTWNRRASFFLFLIPCPTNWTTRRWWTMVLSTLCLHTGWWTWRCRVLGAWWSVRHKPQLVVIASDLEKCKPVWELILNNWFDVYHDSITIISSRDQKIRKTCLVVWKGNKSTPLYWQLLIF